MKSISKSVPVWRSDCCLHPAEKLESMCVVHVRASCGEARLKKKKKTNKPGCKICTTDFSVFFSRFSLP